MCFNQSCFGLRGKKDLIDTNFLYYYLKYYVSNIKKRSQGSVFDTINLASFDFMEIEYPEDISCQQKIEAVLSSLDSKIEINNRINAELETMSKTLYDYWFVQFDFPDENNKPYKRSGGKMVWSKELKREIPEGWEVENISQCCSIIDCLHSKKSELIFEEEGSYLLQLENILDNGLIDLTKKYYVTKDEYKKWTSRIEVIDGDIVITNAGRVAANAQIPYGVKAGIGRNITAIRPVNISSTYLFLSMQGSDIQRQIKLNTDSGAFFTSFNVKGIKKLQILRPANILENQFEELVKPIRRKREINNTENQKLVELRDWLLPMLMNGQVKVD
jgi:type I restriction enzyme S subunit